MLVLASGVLAAACTSTSTPTTVTTTTTTAASVTGSTLFPPQPTPEVVSPPLPADDLAAYVFGVWQEGDLERLQELTWDEAFQVLASRPPEDDDAWVFDHCRSVAHITYCAWVGSTEILAFKVSEYEAYRGYPAVFGAAFRSKG